MLSTKQKYGLLGALYLGLTWSEVVTASSLKWAIMAAAWTGLSRNTIYLIYHTLGRDMRAAMMMLKLMYLVKRAELRNWTVPKMFTETANRIPDKVMFYFEDQKYTFKEVEEESNRVANYFESKGYKKGDSVALFMENRPEFVTIWLGLCKIGVVPAFINYNLRHEALIHSVKVANSKALIFGAELFQAVSDVISSLGSDSLPFPSFCHGELKHSSSKGCFPTTQLANELTDFSSLPVSQAIQDSIGFRDKLLYIYTSGTTGMPKAAVIKHSRYILAAGGCRYVIGCNGDDIIYSPLPLYHSVAGMISLAGTMLHGTTMVMRNKFSASSYWEDCVKYKVTAAQYIGEICRFLLNSRECEEEKRHTVRLMFGNGLRPQIWRNFVNRFAIEKIAEFYGSTEGNSQIINIENKVGAVGFVSLLFPGILPLGLIKINEETGKEFRDRSGKCIPCEPGEPGEFVGKIVRNHPVRDFHGYADESSTRKKILENVFSKGDLFFRSGDILVMDDLGWLYFKDRAGDTYRWRGENVSTNEVEATVSNMISLKDAIVYGVEVPGNEGRAGMAAIHDPEGEVDLERLATGVKEKLPFYSRPMFLRLVDRLEMTGTFKLKKFTLQHEGFDPSVVSDKLFFLHPKTGNYEILNKELFNAIVTGSLRL